MDTIKTMEDWLRQNNESEIRVEFNIGIKGVMYLQPGFAYEAQGDEICISPVPDALTGKAKFDVQLGVRKHMMTLTIKSGAEITSLSADVIKLSMTGGEFMFERVWG